jgi:colicin import membrane protein
MKKVVVFMMAVFLVFSLNSFSQTKTQKTTKKSTTVQTAKKEAKTDVKEAKTEAKADVKAAEADKPGQGDKVVTGKKGPEGQSVYMGTKGGHYYINKNGHKTYLSPDKK